MRAFTTGTVAGDRRWANEARNGVLAVYEHRTPQILLLPAGRGGFGSSEVGMSFAQLAVWLGYLGYGIALAYLADVLGSEGDVEIHVPVALRGVLEGSA